MTILPSPEPMSRTLTSFEGFLGKTFKIFLSWLSVAGINGRVNFLNAGDTKGKQTMLIPTATAAEVPIKIFPVRLVLVDFDCKVI